MKKTVNNPLLEGEIIAKRKYGITTHIMLLTPDGKAPQTGALCGTIPTGSPRRAGWWALNSTTEVTCQKCKKILSDREACHD
ncbi:hypothetical protein LB424_02900 [Klebsiella pneumoniae]|uniref:hypothetical protein n=1 Tax=Klebsiella pneumoniae TaxID=573 RepID=UPI001E36457F|nr:hypothetical protein [Klebsiella pneumoniae]MCD5639553.1 hypothetical protein [Klebsiella pneumoniae]